jgi:hypothetical protein
LERAIKGRGIKTDPKPVKLVLMVVEVSVVVVGGGGGNSLGEGH